MREENVQSQTSACCRSGAEDVLFYSQAGEIPPAVRDALAKAVKLKQAVADTQRQINEHDGQVNTLTADQNRIRENIKTRGQHSAYATRLLKKLDDQESQIEKLRNETEACARSSTSRTARWRTISTA